MAAETLSVKILHQFQISPLPGSVPTTSLPLTFLDIPWFLCMPVQRLFFYEFPHSTDHFMQNILPDLTASLSFTLQQFFPLAANAVCPLQPSKPYLLFTDGKSSVPFTVAESAADFDRITSYGVRDVKELHPFVPKLPPACATSDNTRFLPLAAFQVTLFPNSGICVGIEFLHVVADGMAFNHFMKSWAAVSRSKGDLAWLENSLPFHDKAAIKDPNELECVYLKDYFDLASSWGNKIGSIHEDLLANKVRTTFLISKAHIERIKDWLSNQVRTNNSDVEEQIHVSTFVATCALMWAALIQSEQNEQQSNNSSSVDKDKLCHFVFLADSRHRLEPKLPTTYFGNCLSIRFISANRSELLGVNGVVAAAQKIGNEVKELEGSGVLRGAEKWMSTWKEFIERGQAVLTVAGSPKLRVYDTDFGWGRPKKSEVVHIDISGSIYLSECRDEVGGIEVGIALGKDQMGVFSAIFEQHLNRILNVKN